MYGCPQCRRRRAFATSLSPAGPPGLTRRLPSHTAGAWRLCPTIALARAVPCWCVRGARGRPGVGPVPRCAPPPPPGRPLPYGAPTVGVAGCRFQVSLVFARWYAIPCGLCVPRSQSGGPFRFARRVLRVLVCARSRAARVPPSLFRLPPPPPPRLSPSRAQREVPMQGAGTPVSCGLRPSVFPVRVPTPLFLGGGGVFWSPFRPPCWRVDSGAGAFGLRRRGVWTQAPVGLSREGVWTQVPVWFARGGVWTQAPGRLDTGAGENTKKRKKNRQH